jgi:hypothetical protein
MTICRQHNKMMGYLTWQIACPKLRKSEQEQIDGMNDHPMHNSGNTASLVRQKKHQNVGYRFLRKMN